MSQDYRIMNDIMKEHNERMQNLRRYYPFFCLQESSLNLYKEGRYAFVDMGYITMAVLRFFIEENNFNERDVTYSQYAKFVTSLLQKDFELYLEEEENKDLVLYIFDKLRNDGKPFCMDYYDPAEHKKKTARMKLLSSRIEDDVIYYSITADAIEFYLDTKEVKDESKISIQQLLLEKMIDSKNFGGGIEIVRRINNEVSRLKLQKKEVLSILSYQVVEGMKAFEDYMNTGIRWFEEEQKLFLKNKELIDKALLRAEEESVIEGNKDNYKKVLSDIYSLETELKKAITKHSELLADCMELQMRVDEIIHTSKLSRLRNTFDFKKYVKQAKERDRLDLLEGIVTPLLGMKINKSFYLPTIEELLTYQNIQAPDTEEVEERKESFYSYQDEIEEERIEVNYQAILRCLLDTLLIRDSFDLRILNQILETKFFDGVLRNSDYYSFLVHLCQKKEYEIAKLMRTQDTFLEGTLYRMLSKDRNHKYHGLKFGIELSEELNEDLLENHQFINLEEEIRFTTSNIRFYRL